MRPRRVPELQESAMRWTLEPPTPDTPSSADEVIERLLAESQAYRTLLQLALGQLFDSTTRERHRRGGRHDADR